MGDESGTDAVGIGGRVRGRAGSMAMTSTEAGRVCRHGHVAHVDGDLVVCPGSGWSCLAPRGPSGRAGGRRAAEDPDPNAPLTRGEALRDVDGPGHVRAAPPIPGPNGALECGP